jgi:hypothetical protein
MAQMWSNNYKLLLSVFAYSAIFPITNLAGGEAAGFGIFVSLPFLPVAWMGGVVTVWIAGSEKFYLIGAFIAIFIQVWLVALVLFPTRKNNDVKET